MDCPQCKAPIAANKAFCPRCGTAVVGDSTSTLTVDAQSLRKLLALRAPGLELTDRGRLVSGPLEIDPVRLLKPELRLKAGGVTVSVDQLTLGPGGLTVSLHLQ